ncbi:Superkiller protein 3 [Coemansia sp. RSA 1822]|nr:Superkiller protein 3 [Coemansia sp. RSA 638]KAJ2566739.1 Superkiller protein 3 [Coemansia sp. RSA 1822]
MSVIYKAKLKAAKTAVAEKNYDYAYDLCHDLLELDASSYPVHILLGVSCQHLEKWSEGTSVYERAKLLPKANTLAWQGVCALYEASGDRTKHEHALRALCDRLIAEGNACKAWECMQKVLVLLESSGDVRQLVRALQELAPGGQYNALLDVNGADPQPPTLVDLLSRMYTIERDLDTRLVDSEVNKRRTRLGAGPISRVRMEVRSEVFAESGLLATLALLVEHSMNGPVDQLVEREEQYFESLFDRLLFVEPRSDAVAQLVNLAEDLVANDRCAKAFELLIEMSDAGDRVNELAPKLVELFPDAELAPAARAWMHSDAVDVAGDARESPFAHLQVVAHMEQLGRDRACVDAAARARHAQHEFSEKYKVQLPRSRMQVDLASAGSYLRIGPEHAGDAEELYRSCLETDSECTVAALGLGLATCALGNNEEGCQILQQLVDADPLNHRAWGGLANAQLAAGNTDGAVSAYKQAISVDPLCAEYHAGLADAYWRSGGEWQSDKQYAYASWLAAARVDATMPRVFSGLGQWYQQYGTDPVRAKRCFAKAMSLDCTNPVAGPLLADIYAREGQDDECEQLLLSATDALFSQPWAWRRLGFLYLRQHTYDRAVHAFQNALSADRSSCVCWEGLCEAYLAIGRIHTAVKVARKVKEIDASRVSAHWLCAQAAMRARMLDSALGHFADACECAKGDVMWTRVLEVGRAECLTLCAEKWYHDGLFGRAAEACSTALSAMLECGPQSFLEWGIVHVSCVWMARVHSQFTKHPELFDTNALEALMGCAQSQITCGPMPAYLSQVVDKARQELQECDSKVRLVLELAAAAAQLRVVLAESTVLAASSWTDLGSVYYTYSTETASSPLLFQSQASYPSTKLLEAAADCATAAMQLDSSAQAANLQGAIAALSKNSALAQHAFIVATRRAVLSGLPWANLGCVYVMHGDMELANKAFARAQMIEPDFYGGWMGQALVAECVDASECVDLYEACLVQEGVSTEVADFGYAYQVWQTFARLGDTERALSHTEQNRLLLAIYAARRYVSRSNDEHGAGHYLLGMLLEHNGEYESAAWAYEQALSKPQISVEHEWTMWSALGRAQCSSEQYVESVTSYARAAELSGIGSDHLTLGQTFGFLLGHSLALFFANQLEDSLHMFEEAEKHATLVGEKLAISELLAQVLWALGTDEHKQMARQHLVDALSSHSSVHSLCVLFAMGVLSDTEVAEAAYAELQGQNDPNHDVSRLESYVAALRGDKSGGRRALARAVYKSPDDARVWLLMADFDSLCGHESRAAQSAWRLFGVRGQNAWTMQSGVQSAQLDVAVMALSHLARECKSAGKKAVMYQPWVDQNWCHIE